MSVFRRIVAEPFVRFLAIGAVIFAAFGAVDGGPATGDRATILVSEGRIAELRAGFRRVWNREPDDGEMDNLVREFVREEVLYREALALGLDRDDPVIRNRLRYKLEFLADSGVELLEPGDEVLVAFMRENSADYETGPRIAFRQIYLGERPSAETVEAALAAARAEGGPGWQELGQRSLLPSAMDLADRRVVESIFGAGFFEAVDGLEGGSWSGPVASGYGQHLVLVTGREAGRTPELAEIRDAVLRDWRQRRAQEIKDAQFENLRARYDVVVAEETAQ